MLRHTCRIPHRPPDSYGDCLRASVASLLDIADPFDVPHFADGGVSGEQQAATVRSWLVTRGLVPWWTAFDGAMVFDDLCLILDIQNPGVPVLVFGRSRTGPHVVIVQHGRIAHDSAWVSSGLVGADGPAWLVMTIGVLL